MNFVHIPKAFDPKDVATRLGKSRVRDHEGWRAHLSTMTNDQCYYVQKEFLQRHSAVQFDGWFGMAALLTQLSRDPLLASMHNPQAWLYAFEQSITSPFSSCSVLYAYWSSVALMRPSVHFEPKLLARIHDAVGRAVRFVDADGQPWTTGLTPAVLSCPEEIAMFTLPWPKALDAVTAYVQQYRDLGSLQEMPIAYPILSVLLKIIEGGCFPARYQTSPLPWPTPEPGIAWSNDLQLSLHAVRSHPQLKNWWVLPTDAPMLPEHLQEATIMYDIGVQLGYLQTLKDWIAHA